MQVEIEASVGVDPFFEFVTVIGRRIFLSARTSGKTISSSMLLSRDVDRFEIEEEDGGNPSVDGIVRVEGRGIDHVLHKLRVHLDYQLLYTNGEDLRMLQGAEEAVELQLRLRVSGFAIVEGDGAKSTGISFPILPDLEENVSNAVGTGVNSEDDWSIGLVVDRS